MGKSRAQLVRESEELRLRAELAEAQLRATKVQLRSFMEAASDGFLLLDSELRVIDVTYRDLLGFGIQPEALLGKSLGELSPGFRIEGRLEPFREILRTGNPFTVEDYSPSWPPEWENRRITQKAFRVGDGVGVIYTDITDRKRAEDELRKSEALYRLLAENVTDVIWTVDSVGHLTYISPSVSYLLGYAPSEILGLSAFAFVAAPHKRRLRDSLRRYFDGRHDVKSGAPTSLSIELEVTRKDGHTLWSETILSMLPADGQVPNRVLGITRDIRERKQAQELFQTLADSSPIGVYISRKGRLAFANRQFAEYAGCPSEELMDTETASFILPEDRGMARKNAVEMLKGQRQMPYVFRCRAADGRIQWAMERLASVVLHGEPAILGNLMDITKTKEDEEALRRSERELRLLSLRVLEIQDEERSQFARDLHDQLGQQIFALKMEVGLLLERMPERSSARTRILSLVELVNRLQSTCRSIAVGIRSLPWEGLGIRDAIQRSAEEFERRSGVSCPVQTPPCEPVLSGAANVVIHQVLQEALLNVWRHAKAAQVNVTLSQIGHSMVLEVADDGIGFESDEVGDPALLGLRGMQERARLLGGSVDIDSHRGCGTTVRLQLPLLETKEEANGHLSMQ